MKPTSESSAQEVLAGLVERVTFHNAESGFCVLRAKARGHRDLVTVVGHAAIISAGEWITASGKWIMIAPSLFRFRARQGAASAEFEQQHGLQITWSMTTPTARSPSGVATEINTYN